jgi:hypothetical protein
MQNPCRKGFGNSSYLQEITKHPDNRHFMGYKAVCFDCRKAFNFNAHTESNSHLKCPECTQPLVLIDHKFRPPKKSDIKAWAVAKFLCENGFPYHRVYKEIDENIFKNHASYPSTMKEAIAFIETYKEQARK